MTQCYLRFFDQSPVLLDWEYFLYLSSYLKECQFRVNGKRSTSNFLQLITDIKESVSPLTIIDVMGRLLGGKGGFGSMLRAQGGRMSKRKASSYDSCRNLDGVRIGVKKQAVALATFIHEEPHREREKEAEIEKAIEAALNPTEKKYYAKGISEYLRTQEALSEALEQAFEDQLSDDDSLDGNSASDKDLDPKVTDNSDLESDTDPSIENQSPVSSFVECRM